MKMEIGEGKRRIVYLFSPSLAKTVQIAVWEDQMLDLGSIARAFELDPCSLKLNGHFIARGVDFIASSVTWRSLVSFFSARGLSTGATVSDPLIVDGIPSKLGSKRMHDPTDARIEDCNADYHLVRGANSYPNKKIVFRDSISSFCKTGSKASDPGNEDTKDGQTLGIAISSGEYSSCGGIDKNMKRNREDSLDLANSHKRTRV